jgi:hypothetical protein
LNYHQECKKKDLNYRGKFREYDVQKTVLNNGGWGVKKESKHTTGLLSAGCGSKKKERTAPLSR